MSERGLVGEWAAQWAGLLEGMRKDEIRWTCVGRGVVVSGVKVWLSSKEAEDGECQGGEEVGAGEEEGCGGVGGAVYVNFGLL